MALEEQPGFVGHIPFNRPPLVGTEHAYIAEAIARGQISAGGFFTSRCCDWLETAITGTRALLVNSATAALEMASLLLEIGPGDEVVMPSFNFVSAANAVALRGGTPVFVDIRPDTLNLDEHLLESALTSRTKAIVVVHYAGVPCEMDRINAIAAGAGIAVIEDAAQALGSRYYGRPAGSLGALAAVSFHETKNVTSGEGGALLIGSEKLLRRAEILRDKGTDRGRYLRKEVAKYSWVDLGSSYGLSELNAAFLWAQLEVSDQVTAERLRTWSAYHEALQPLEDAGHIRRPVVPEHIQHNAHIYYVLAGSPHERTRLLQALNSSGINAVFHYVPLHSSEAGRRYGRPHGKLGVTKDLADRIIRLPLYSGMTVGEVERITEELALASRAAARATAAA